MGALERVRVGHVDLLVLDLGLPGMDGLEVCRRLRPDFPDLPVLMLTARTDEVDFVVGLDAGADDYVSKPFRLAELLARVRALLRRLTPETVEVGGVRMELSGRRVLVDGAEVDLANKEFELLRVLHAARRAGRHPRGDPARGVERPRHEDVARPSTCTCPGCAARSAASAGSRRCAASASASTTTDAAPCAAASCSRRCWSSRSPRWCSGCRSPSPRGGWWRTSPGPTCSTGSNRSRPGSTGPARSTPSTRTRWRWPSPPAGG